MINFLINNLMMPLLRFFYDITGSYGWAIIFVTVAVKSALMPLTFRSIKAQMDMQRIQPLMKELQAKYKDKPELLNQEMIKLYKDHRVNPLSGCLPILVQLPFFIAVYSTFVSKEFNALAGGNSSFFFIQDLSKKDLTPDNIFLVIAFGISTFISQKMMITNPDDPTQKQMLYIMPIMMVIMFYNFHVPSAALLYMVSSNLFSLVQNFFVLKEKKRLGATTSGSSVVEKNAKDILNSKISLEKNNSSIMLEKEIVTSNSSPVMSSSSKSKRVKKDQKKNRKK